MSVEFPLDAFDDAHVIVRRRVRPRINRSKLASIAITTAIHLIVAGIAFRTVQAPPMEPQKILTVQITPQSEPLQADIVPILQLERPPVVTSIMPEVTVQSAPSEITAQPPAPQVAPQPLPPVPKASDESRESYFNTLLAQLNRYKQYPLAARVARKQGVVLLHFVMDSQGKVSSFQIAKSSGHKELDNEVLALIQRAQPLPPLPADFATRTLDVVVPIAFTLNR